MPDSLVCSTSAYADLVALLRGIRECSAYAEEIASAAMDLRPDDARRFALLIAAVGQVETLWGRATGYQGTTGPGIVGADGHGRGLMQVDDRYHRLELWADPRVNIRAGAQILDGCVRTFEGNLAAGVACYNAGPARVREELSLTPPDVDAHTTGHDYSARVLDHYRRWSLLVVP